MSLAAEVQPGRVRGFTLIEVVVAMAILMLFLVPILGSVTSGLAGVRQAKNRSLALQLAQEKMEQIRMLPLPEAEGDENGDFGDDYPGFRWQVQFIKSTDLELMEEQIPSLRGMEVHLDVIWEEAGVEKSLSVSTLLLE